jgi:hypothetical protein
MPEMEFNEATYPDGSRPIAMPSLAPAWLSEPERRAAEAREAHRLAWEANEAAHRQYEQRMTRLEGALRVKLAAPMPAPAELGVDVSGLEPARAKLVTGLRWVEIERDKIAVLEAKRDAFMAALGAPKATKEEIARADGLVRTAFKRFFNNGSTGEAPDLKAVERAALKERLEAEDKEAAKIADGLLAECEEAIEVQRNYVTRLEGRIAGWRSAALAEVGTPVAARIQKLLDALRLEMACMTALGQVAGGSLGSIAGGTKINIGVTLPYDIAGSSGLPVPGGERVEPITSEWRATLAKITADPRATVSAPRSRVILPLPKPMPAIVEKVIQLVAPKSAPQPEPEPDYSGQFEFTQYSGPLG